MKLYDPLDRFYKSVIGAVQENEKIIFRVKGEFDSVFFVLRRDGEEGECKIKMMKKDGFFELEKEFDKVGLYFYRFDTEKGSVKCDKNYLGELNGGAEFELTVFSSDFTLPKWLEGGTIYQIFPDRFCDSGEKKKVPKGKILHKNKNEMPIFMPDQNGEVINNDFFGGDLKGIEKKLPYLKSLGVTAIYLNPIFEAYSNHRYDTGDYMKIDSLLGTEEDFLSLISSCGKVGIGVILDGVFNHTGSKSVYFNKDGEYDSLGAYQSKNSPYYDWYKFKSFPNDYESWWGVKTLPATDKNNGGFVSFITGENGVIEKYTSMGVKGWRLDVVDELPATFVRKIRDAVKRVDKDAVIIGEVWEDASNKISYGIRRQYFLGSELDGVMNYPLKDAIINYILNGDAKEFSFAVKTLVDHYPKNVLDLCMNILSTHDTARIFSVLSGVPVVGLSKKEMANIFLSESEEELAEKRLKLASVLQFCMPGVPSVYYGDEIGMQGFFDPFNRAFFSEEKKNAALLSHYRKLGKIRSKSLALKNGDFTEVFSGRDIYAFKRTADSEEVFVAVNAGDNAGRLVFSGKLYDLLNEKFYEDEILIKPLSALVLSCARD